MKCNVDPAVSVSSLFQMILVTMGLLNCILSLSHTTYTVAEQSCGDGIVQNEGLEGGEQCDCGERNEGCNSACCDQSTCQLIGSAECAQGSCCDIQNCKLKTRGSTCREAGPEYCYESGFCSGNSSNCPSPTHKDSFSKCSIEGTVGSCLEGKCTTIDGQCQYFDLSGTSDSGLMNLCFSVLDPNPSQPGSCDFCESDNLDGYEPCEKQNSKCGALSCQSTGRDSNSQGIYLNIDAIDIYGDPANPLDLIHVVYRVATTEDTAFIPNGASCEGDKVYYNQVCMSREEASTRSQADSVTRRKCPISPVVTSTTSPPSTSTTSPPSTSTTSPPSTSTMITSSSKSTLTSERSSYSTVNDITSSNPTSNSNGLIIGLSVAGGVILLTFLFCLLYRCCCPGFAIAPTGALSPEPVPSYTPPVERYIPVIYERTRIVPIIERAGNPRRVIRQPRSVFRQPALRYAGAKYPERAFMSPGF